MGKYWLSDNEIRQAYKYAVEKSKQITILAQMCCVSRTEMKNYLQQLGVDFQKEYTRVHGGGKDRVNLSTEETICIVADRKCGMSFKAISQKHGLSIHVIKRVIGEELVQCPEMTGCLLKRAKRSASGPNAV